jgi:thioredoxin 2
MNRPRNEDDTLNVVCPDCRRRIRVPANRLRDQPRCPACKTGIFRAEPLELDADSFDTFARHSDVPLLVDFWAPWCAPCRGFAPVIAEAAAEFTPSVIVAKLNTEDAPALASRLGIRSIPTIAVFRAGTEIARQSGAMPLAALQRWLAGTGVLRAA